MRNAGIYVRLSQDTDGSGQNVRDQEADCRALAKRRGWTVVDVYDDNDVSAGGRRRPKERRNWRRLLADLESERIDAVLAYSSSRMYRHVRDLADLIDIAEVRGVEIGTVVSGTIDLTTADGRMLARILADVDQREWEATSERWKAQKRRAVAAGRYTGGEKEPFGYRRIDRRLAVDPDEAALLHEAVARLGRGESLYRIAADWNAAGKRTSKGAMWRPASIRRTLASRHLRGERGYPAVLDETEVAIVDARLGAERVPGRGRPPGRRYPLTGFLFCSECGSKMSAHSGAYRCDTSKAGCGRVSIRATPLERWLLNEVAVRPAPTTESVAPLPDVEPLLAELRKLDGELDELADAELPLRLVKRRAIRVEGRRSKLTQELARSLPAPNATPTIEVFHTDDVFGPGFFSLNDPDLAERWERRELTDLEVMQMRDQFAAYLKRVPIKPRKKRGRSFDPTRVGKPVWR
jgi:site-specific DNA recombinase